MRLRALVAVLAAAATLAFPAGALASGAVNGGATQAGVSAGAGSVFDGDAASDPASYSGSVSVTAPETPSASASAQMNTSLANGQDSVTVDGDGGMACSQPAGGAGAGASNLFEAQINVSAQSGVAYSASLSGTGEVVEMWLLDENEQPVFILESPGSQSPSGTLPPGEYDLHVQINCSIEPFTAQPESRNASFSLSAQFGLNPAPSVTIVNGPSGTVATRDARFEFVTTNPSPPPGRFECRADGQGTDAFTPCSSPVDLIGLADGEHFFEVRYHPDGEAPGPAAGRRWTVDTTCDDVKVGFALAQGCFTETQPGSGIFETEGQAWVGGFEIVPRPGGKLVLNTGAPAVSESGAGVDVVFAGFKVPIAVSALPVGVASGSLALLGGGGTVGGLLDIPVEGSAKAAWAAGGGAANFEAEIKVGDLTKPIGGLVTLAQGQSVKKPAGKLKAKLENGVGFVLQQGEVSIDEIAVIPKSLVVPRTLALKNLLLRFALKDGKPFWTGRAGIGLPLSRGDLDVTGTVFIFDGSLAGGGLEVDGINKRALGPLFLQKVGGDLLFAPKFGYDLRVGATLGPKVKGKKLVSIDGTAQGGPLVTGCAAGSDPTKLQAVAKLAPLEGLQQAGLAKVDITTRSCIYPGAGTAIEGVIEGDISFANNLFGYRGTQTGFVSTSGASYEGAVRLRLPGRSDLNGSAIISTVGVAACATVGRFDLGFGYVWDQAGPPSPFTGCSLAPFRVTVAPARSGRAAARMRIPDGLPHVAFAASAAAGAPQVKVSGPGGVSLQSPADGSALQTRRALIIPVAQERTTYVLVDDPRPGSWRVDPVDPGTALSRVRVARGLPKPQVEGRVGKLGKKLRFRYTVARLPGQRVRFMERGEGVGRVLGAARGRRGTIVFEPTVAARRARTIEAEVIQDGLPRALLTVARFKAPKPRRPARPSPRATRKTTTLALRWPAVPGAANYLVEVAKGRATLQRALTRKRRVSFRGLPARGRLRVSVQALSDIVAPGPPARLTVK